MRERITLARLGTRSETTRGPAAGANSTPGAAPAAPAVTHAAAPAMPAESLALLRAHAAKLLREPANLKPEVFRWAQRLTQ